MEMYIKKMVASRSIDNRFRIESLTSKSESNRIVRCQEIPTPSVCVYVYVYVYVYAYVYACVCVCMQVCTSTSLLLILTKLQRTVTLDYLVFPETSRGRPSKGMVA